VSLTAMDLKDLNYIAFRSDTLPQPEQDIFIADSGASVHLTGSIERMINLKELKNDRVTVCDGISILAEKNW